VHSAVEDVLQELTHVAHEEEEEIYLAQTKIQVVDNII